MHKHFQEVQAGYQMAVYFAHSACFFEYVDYCVHQGLYKKRVVNRVKDYFNI